MTTDPLTTSLKVQSNKPMKVTAGVLLFLIGALFIAAGFSNTLKAFFAAGWPATSATILSVSVTEAEAARSSQNFSLSVNYTYEAQGNTFTANRINFPDRTYPSRSAAESASAPWAIGTTVPVHINPQNPSESVLKPEPDYAYLTVFSLLGLACLIPAILLLRNKNKPKPTHIDSNH